MAKFVARPSSNLWALPKGTPEPGESIEQTAIREVSEETGLQVQIVAPVCSIAYSFKLAGEGVGLADLLATSLGFLFHWVTILSYAAMGTIGLLRSIDVASPTISSCA